MSLTDLMVGIYRSWKIVLVLPIICALVGAAVLFTMPPKWEAEATIITSQAKTIDGLAEGIAGARALDVSISDDTSKKTVILWMSGSDPYKCLNTVNDLAYETEQVASELYPRAVVNVIAAQSAEDISPAKLPYLIVALMAGLFIAVCIVVFADLVSRPARNATDIEGKLGCKMAGIFHRGDDEGNRMLMSKIDFVAADQKTLCLVPAGKGASLEAVANLISTYGNSAYKAVFAQSFSVDPDALKMAYDADAVLLVIDEWRTTEAELTAVMRDLSIVSANVVGFVLAKTKPNGVEAVSMLVRALR